ncbi:MAG: hypothetical protein U1F66_11725 [bacterium]
MEKVYSHQNHPTPAYPKEYTYGDEQDYAYDFDGGPSDGYIHPSGQSPGKTGKNDAPRSRSGEMDDDFEKWLESQGSKTKETDSEKDPKTENLPYRLQDGVRVYDAKDGDRDPNYDFELEINGEKNTSAVETAGSVTLNLPKDAVAKISQSGKYLVVKCKKETVKIDLNKASSIHFVGGKVSGDVENSEKKITTDQGVFIPEKDITNLEDILGGLSEKIGAVEKIDPPNPSSPGAPVDPYSPIPGVGVSPDLLPQETKMPEEKKYIFGKKVADSAAQIESGKKQVEKVKEIFDAMSEALREKDPKKQKELWEDVTDNLKDYVTQDKEGGDANNVGHMIGGILMEELGGKRQLASVFEKGLIPESFGEAILTALKAHPLETTDMADVESWYQGGALATITHGTLANAFEKAVRGKGGKDEN